MREPVARIPAVSALAGAVPPGESVQLLFGPGSKTSVLLAAAGAHDIGADFGVDDTQPINLEALATVVHAVHGVAGELTWPNGDPVEVRAHPASALHPCLLRRHLAAAMVRGSCEELDILELLPTRSIAATKQARCI